MCYREGMIDRLKDVLERAKSWPEADQMELAELAEQIELRQQRNEYHATAEELQAIDEADRSETAQDEVEAAFRAFRRV
jgi:hypothetical protein